MLVNRHPVQVTCVHPGGVRTAIARNAAVAQGHDPAVAAARFDTHLARTSAERAATDIVEGMLAGKPRVLVGRDARLLDALVRVTGPGYQRLVAAAVGRSRGRG
jgi:short-subunit dehydrogenase